MQIKTTGKCHFLTYHASKGPKLWHHAQQAWPSATDTLLIWMMGMRNASTPVRGNLAGSSKMPQVFILWPSHHTSRNLFHRNTGNETKRHMYQAVHFGAVWNSKRLERSQKPVNIDLVGLAILCPPKGVLHSCKRNCRTFLYSTQTFKLPHALSVLVTVSWHSWAEKNT